MRRRIDHWRLIVVLGASCAVLLVIGYRVFTVAYVRHGWYASAARAHAENSQTVLSRGAVLIRDQDGTETALATNARFAVATVNAHEVSEDAGPLVAEALATLASVEPERVLDILASERDLALPVGAYLDDTAVRRIEELKIPGVRTANVIDRSYPDGSLAADVVGFFGYDPDGRHGQYGVEAFYEPELSGESDRGERLLGTQWLAGLFGSTPGASDVPVPADVILTLDRTIQAYIEGVLEETLAKYGAISGSVVVQEVATGRIIGMADRPTFDPNRYGEAPTASFLNSAVQIPFEPGSSFKPFTMAIGLDTRSIDADDTFTDTGSVTVAGHTIRNFREAPFGTVTMSQILENSINTGTMHIEERTGDEEFLSHLIDFGFGQRTGIDVPGEATGNLENLYSGRKINYLTASFGQGITVTPLQLTAAYSALANDGRLMRPMVVDRIVRDGTVIREVVPEVASTPVSPRTAAQVREMLVSVVDNGFDKARIPRYHVAGKTGTAQIADPEGGYLENEYIHSFAGFIPGLEPRYTIVIVMERPHGVTFAADSLSPVFRDIATFLINYYRIPPTR